MFNFWDLPILCHRTKAPSRTLQIAYGIPNTCICVIDEAFSPWSLELCRRSFRNASTLNPQGSHSRRQTALLEGMGTGCGCAPRHLALGP